MSVDGPIKAETSGGSTPMTNVDAEITQSGYLAGSKALSSLDKLITSTESFFHPSNSGPWTVLVSNGLLSVTCDANERDEAFVVFITSHRRVLQESEGGGGANM